MFNIQSEKEMIQRAEAERQRLIYDAKVKQLNVIRAKAIEVIKAKNRSMVKKQLVLDNGYKEALIEMARDYQVSTSVIIRVACEYFHEVLNLADVGSLGNEPRFGEHTDNKQWRAVIWVQKNLSEQIEWDARRAGMSQSRFVRAAITELYNGYTISCMKDASRFEKAVADLIWRDKHSYEN